VNFDGIVVKRSTGELASYQQKMFRIDDHVGIAIAGLTSDARVLRCVCLQAMIHGMLDFIFGRVSLAISCDRKRCLRRWSSTALFLSIAWYQPSPIVRHPSLYRFLILNEPSFKRHKSIPKNMVVDRTVLDFSSSARINLALISTSSRPQGTHMNTTQCQLVREVRARRRI
jgi:hypothetical protein